MAWQHDTMMNPPIEGLLDRAESKFRLVTLGARRARQINSYFGQLGDGAVEIVVDDGDRPEAAAEVTLGERLVEPLADLLVGVTPFAESALLLGRAGRVHEDQDRLGEPALDLGGALDVDLEGA